MNAVSQEWIETLPLTFRWTQLLVWTGVGFVVGAGSTWIGARLATGPVPDASRRHWTETARWLYPTRTVFSVSVTCPLVAMGLTALLRVGPFSPLGATSFALFVAGSTYLGAAWMRRAVRRRLDRTLERAPRPGNWNWQAVILAYPHVIVVLAMAFLVGRDPFAMPDLAWALLGTALYLGCLVRAGLPLLRVLGQAKPPNARLQAVVDRVSERAGVRPRASWVLNWSMPNALALPWTQELVFSTRILEVLSDEELEAITAHEVGHLRESTRTRAARTAFALCLLPLGFAHYATLEHGTSFWWVMAGLLVAVLAASRWSRRLEAAADAHAVDHESEEGVHARALEALYRAADTPAVLSKGTGSHPNLFDRMVASGVTPDYPRPAPPARHRMLFGFLGVVGSILLANYALLRAPGWLVSEEDPSLEAYERQVAWTAGRRGLHDLGLWETNTRDWETGIRYLDLATTTNPRGHHAPADAAFLLAHAGRCGEAAARLTVSEDRMAEPESCPRIRRAREALVSCEEDEAVSAPL
ncbi:MAG: M48 family metalloprotease [Myxococcota bacterium]